MKSEIDLEHSAENCESRYTKNCVLNEKIVQKSASAMLCEVNTPMCSHQSMINTTVTSLSNGFLKFLTRFSGKSLQSMSRSFAGRETIRHTLLGVMSVARHICNSTVLAVKRRLPRLLLSDLSSHKQSKTPLENV